ncbi:MAG: YegS/Rv2252/BmrU family lipid kinase [Alistipes sp.]
MKVLFLYNVKAGRGRAEATAEGVCRLFREQGHTISAQPIDFRTNPFEGREQLDLLIAAGGDGTMNYVTNCMKRKGLNIRLAVIPSGTANDFAGAIGMSKNPLEAAQQILDGAVERIDCGCVNGLHFVNVFSFGIFTTTSQRTTDERKHKIGKLAYLIEGAKELRSMHAVPLHVCSEREEFDFNALMVLIFNGETAGGFRLARRSCIKDGLFDCILLEKKNFFCSIFAMLRYLLGGHPKAVRHLRAAQLKITSPLDEPTDVDGQQGAHFPLHIECLEGELQIVCPQQK